jgi:PAS domain S-box-containing protein
MDGHAIWNVGALVQVGREGLIASGMLQLLPLRVLDDAPLGVIIWDSAFHVAEWNKAAERIFGWPRAEAHNQHASFIIPAAFRPLVDDIFRSLMQASGGTHSINDNVHRDGRSITPASGTTRPCAAMIRRSWASSRWCMTSARGSVWKRNSGGFQPS